MAYGILVKALSVAIEFAFCADGAEFTRMRGHTSVGTRVLDIDTVCPITKERLFDDGVDKHGNQKLKGYQRKELSEFMIMGECKETGAYYNNIAHFFDFIQKSIKEGIH